MAQRQVRYCACGTRLARDNHGERCATCQRKAATAAVADPPEVPADFWQHERMRDALDAWHMGHVFHAYRTHPWHGAAISQETLASWLGINQAQLSRIENGKPPHDLRKLMSWAHSLRIPPELLWFRLPDRRQPLSTEGAPTARTKETPPADSDAPDAGVLLPVVLHGRTVFVPVDPRALETSGLGDILAARGEQPADSTTGRETMSPLSRRILLRSGIAAAALPGLGLDDVRHVAAAMDDARRYLDGSVIDYFRTQLEKAKLADGALGPKKTLPAVLGLLGAIEQRARDVKPSIRKQLLAVGADGAEFVGWLYRDIQDPNTAGFWYDRAMEWAQEADDPGMQGYILLKKSQMAYDDRDALRLLTLAQAAANRRWQLPAHVQAEVTQQEALGFAMLGEPLDAVRDKLDQARGLLSNGRFGPSALGGYFTEHTLLVRNAVTYTEAGKPGQAAALFGEVISAGGLSRRDAGFFNARRAVALALSGEPDEAAQVGKSSASVAHELKSERTIRVLGEAVRALDRWRGRPAVREFREALTAN